MKSKALIPREMIRSKILSIRGRKVILDRDLAELYGVETKQLTRQVRRNKERFPVPDFLLFLTQQEVAILKRHFGTSSWGGTRKPSFAFTEHGILMLSSVLNSKRAIQVNVQIMKTFIQLREILENHRELRQKIEAMEAKYDWQFKIVFREIKKLLGSEKRSGRAIGFRPN